ncbi:hypothetical protein D9M70_488180 [compost metagenome]
MNKQNIDLDLANLRREVNRRSEVVQAAGFGLCALADLLGADASEHHMTEELKHGAANAVLAIGELMKEIGVRLWEISEEEPK